MIIGSKRFGAGLVPSRGGVAHGVGSATSMARRCSSDSTNPRSAVEHELHGSARIAGGGMR